jgi:hypothetical protein
MKTLLITTLLVACFSLTSYSQNTTKEKQKPIETYQVGSSKVVVWENKKKDGTTWKNFQIEKVYQTKDGEWKTTNSFNDSQLLELKAAIEKAIIEQNIKEKNK